MNYETITFNQLNNRAPNAYKEDIIPQSNEPKFAVCYLTENGKWWNAFETRDEQAAIAKSESMAKINPDGSRKIFLVVPEAQKPVVEEQVEAEATPESSEVVEQVEASTASTDAEITVEPAHTVKVEADCRKNGSNHSSRHILYSGNDIAAAHRVYQEYRANPSHGTTWIAMFYRVAGAWTQSKRFSYDRADEYLKDWNAGVFNETFKRDIANEEAIRRGGR